LIDYLPIVITGSKLPESDFQAWDFSFSTSCVELFCSLIRLVKIDRRRSSGAGKPLLLPETVGCGELRHHIVSVNRVIGPDANIKPIVAELFRCFTQLLYRQVIKKL
jgi:hypothetical protein